VRFNQSCLNPRSTLRQFVDIIRFLAIIAIRTDRALPMLRLKLFGGFELTREMASRSKSASPSGARSSLTSPSTRGAALTAAAWRRCYGGPNQKSALGTASRKHCRRSPALSVQMAVVWCAVVQAF
jgi:hypothetical protein